VPHRLVLAVLAAVIGGLHLVLAPEYLSEAPVIGLLFIVGGVALLAAAVGLWRSRQRPVALGVGTLVALGMLVGGVLSRTVGLLGFHESDWETSLLLSLALEAVFVLLAARAFARLTPAVSQPR
jgi:hypothetical protein